MPFIVTRLHLTSQKILQEYTRKLQFLGNLHFGLQLLQQYYLHSPKLSQTAVFIDSTELTCLSKPLKIPALKQLLQYHYFQKSITYKHHRENTWTGPIKKLLCRVAIIERDGQKVQQLLGVTNVHGNILTNYVFKTPEDLV